MASSAREVTLIGVCDGALDEKKYRSSFLTNKVGGRPDWQPNISRQCPRCRRCGAPLVHVVQVYCPLNTSPYHRNLHIFACPGAECSGRSECWTVLRSQSLEEQPVGESVPAREAPLSATDWCDSADDWGTEEGDGWGGGGGEKTERKEAAAPGGEASEVDFSRQLQDLHLGESHDDVPFLDSFFISVVEESDLGGEQDELWHAQRLLREYESREGVAVVELEGGGGGSDSEKYEKTRARHGDAVFSRFMKKISLCPQQILRYCHGGRPLFISEPPCDIAQAVTACGTCGGTRTFELQLMPALVSQLQWKDCGGGAVEFGTVLVYTCTNSCWTAGPGSAVEEFLFVQTDPDQQLFR